MMTVFLLLYYQFVFTYSQFNIYSKQDSWTTYLVDHDCLYGHTDIRLPNIITMVPYCLQLEISKENICFGEMIDFEDLKLQNISVDTLFRWNAAIETIDSYAKYLSYPDLIVDNHSYCRCSSALQFGNYCQYQLNSVTIVDGKPSKFNDLLTIKSSVPSVQSQSITCYVGIFCSNIHPCLDWRQICNGIVDCDHAEDEPFELCMQLEVHQCENQTEFRCKNGMCIPIDVSEDDEFDCLDRSDLRTYQNHQSIGQIPLTCSPDDEVHCDELMCEWKEYPCGDSQCLSYADVTEKMCLNQRNVVLLKRSFASASATPCWLSMICLTGFSHLFSNVNCSQINITEHVEQHCPDQYYFPPNPVIYSFVFFLYERKTLLNPLHYTGPDFICYQTDLCSENISILSKVFRNNMTCFRTDSTIFSWSNFYNHVIQLFSPCFLLHESLRLTDKESLYKCNTSQTWISVYRIRDGRNDCSSGEDEDAISIRESIECKQTNSKNELYSFEQLCDRIIDSNLFSGENDENDETDCEYWPYKCHNSPYTECNHVWNCDNGVDELDCRSDIRNPSLQKLFDCRNDEHYCIQFIENRTNIHLTCLHINRTGDGIIDCIGATDERFSSVCTEKYPREYQKRFYCMNSSICITPKQVCDRIIDCPMEDDERVCPWLYTSNLTHFHCQDSSDFPVSRCQSGLRPDHVQCNLQENLWFCDLGFNRRKLTSLYVYLLEMYPVIERTKERTVETMIHSTHREVTSSNMFIGDTNRSICHRGYSIQWLHYPDEKHCMCPPSYYGNHCQYQSERLTVLFTIRQAYYFKPETIFRLLILLLNDQQTIVSHEEILYHHQIETFKRYLVYLIYERRMNTSLYRRMKPKWVRIDSFIIKETNIQYISSWLFTVSFPFLPVNRISVLLNLENELFQATKCRKKCDRHGRCMYYLNAKHQEYCWCQHGWYGERCHLKYVTDLCHERSCAPQSQCMILNYEKKQIKCICALGRSGDQCYIQHNPCHLVHCQNNGTCLPLDQRNHGHMCICKDDYHGEFCEMRRKIMIVNIPENVSISLQIPAILVILTDPVPEILIQRRILFTKLNLPSRVKVYGFVKIGFVQIFHNYSYSSYHLIAIQQKPVSLLNTSVLSSNQCQNITDLFHATILNQYSYLKRMKLYHLPCQNNHYLRCFFDEFRMCLCTRDHFSSCYRFNHEDQSCHYCQNNGLCVQQNEVEAQWKYICICPICFFGSLCQFSTKNYFITLDSLIGPEIRNNYPSIKQQPTIISTTLIILVLIVSVGSISNLISFIILSNKKLQRVNCDIYLLHVTIVSQLALTTLLARFLYMLFIQIYDVENMLAIQICCLCLEYLLRLLPPLFDWFIVCISTERAYIVISNVQYSQLMRSNRVKFTHCIIVLIYLFNILSTLHRPFHLILVGEPIIHSDRIRHPWCILQFHSDRWNIYEKFINIFHLLAPLLLNLISIISFLCYKIKFQLTFSATTTSSNNKFCTILQNQLSKYKSVVISTFLIILLEIPRCIVTFFCACMVHQWHRSILVIVHLISFLPLTTLLFIFILPSPKYKQHLQALLLTCFRKN